MKINNIRNLDVRRLLFLSAVFIYALNTFALTPTQIYEKSKAKINSAKTIDLAFSMSLEGQKIKGSILSKGNKFAIVTNAVSNWYDGKTLYNHSPKRNETTVFNPSESELRETNPLLYLKNASGFKVTGTKNQKKGYETIVLLPQNTKMNVKSVIIDLDKATFLPVGIKINPVNGNSIDIAISKIKLNGTISDSNFEYPKEKFKGAQIIDLR